MKTNHQVVNRTARIMAAILVLGVGLTSKPGLAKDLKKHLGYTVVGQITLPTERATDLFLRRDDQGHKYLYVIYANNTIDVLNVTKEKEISDIRHLSLVAKRQALHVDPVNANFVLVTNMPDSKLVVVDTTNPAAPEIEKEFSHADCYAVDRDGYTLYVVQQGELSVLRFDRPITRDAAIWEQFFEER